MARDTLYLSDEGHKQTYEMTHAAFEGHVIVEAPVRAFSFHNVKAHRTWANLPTGEYPFAKYGPYREHAHFRKQSAYSFGLTWRPGTMTLTGDLGELTIVHHYAMSRFEEAIDWLRSSGFHYLMGKTDATEVYDHHKSLNYLWDAVCEPALESLKALREEMREYRAGVLAAPLEMGEYNKGIPTDWDPAPLEDFLPENPKDSFKFVRRLAEAIRAGGGLYEAPAGFENLCALYEEVSSGDYVNELLTGAGRRRLRAELEDYLSEQRQDEFIDLVQRIGFEDYYGSYRYKDSYVWKIAAIQHGCRLIQSKLGATVAPEDPPTA